MLTDTHCHLDFHKFNQDREDVIQRARDAGLRRILVPGLELRSSKSAVKLANKNEEIFAAIGFHPTDLEHWSEWSISDLKKIAESNAKVVAIGEIGLDYYWVKESEKRIQQREVLKLQLDLATELSLPVIIHIREEEDAWTGPVFTDSLDILIDWQKRLVSADHPLAHRPGVLHSFNGELDIAQKAIEHNFYIGITGPVTYRTAEKKREVVGKLPLERLLIETDSPFLSPVPHRGERNEPAFVAHIADKIAEIHKTTREQFEQITYTNALKLFGWGG